jgi:phosphatidylethanolamine/phosphatidyl-N-methylethanolamine N-methyltransferase
MIKDSGAFLAGLARHPARIGAVAPSSARLAEQVAAPVAEHGEPLVVELGPGTGAVTKTIQHRLAGRGLHLAVEIDPRFAERLRERFPTVQVVVADAAELPDLLATLGLPRAHAIVSGLPWAVLRPDVQQRLMAAVTDGLDPDGAFTTFAYVHSRWTPAGLRLRHLLRDTFEEVVLGRTVWANLPPALVYHTRRPRHASRTARALADSARLDPSWA